MVITCLEVKNVVVQFLCDEFVFLKTLICNVEDGVFVGRLVVHVEHDVSFGDGYNCGDISCFRFDSIFTDWNVHVGSVSFEKLNWPQRGQITHRFWL